jgi:hypothetical protein
VLIIAITTLLNQLIWISYYINATRSNYDADFYIMEHLIQDQCIFTSIDLISYNAKWEELNPTTLKYELLSVNQTRERTGSGIIPFSEPFSATCLINHCSPYYLAATQAEQVIYCGAISFIDDYETVYLNKWDVWTVDIWLVRLACFSILGIIIAACFLLLTFYTIPGDAI